MIDWHKSNYVRLKEGELCQTIFSKNHSSRFMRRRTEVLSVINRELDISRLLMHQRWVSYAVMSLLTQNQRQFVRKLSKRLSKKSDDDN